ncbi:2-isopropylmalate synthase [Sulfidibacter corallicola]|uniref:2-isopropylmalate synthase n=1 Tax=Sulfidibacter corallicola TaxID=2818388 RepID=A0A8A4TSX6_SULCO|nr:2-isopropylmalate synthase [Sulfidibacter corallicola]QTD52151.1 2-isopropylmalate synthase [Sulfidibacter corallicola]
MEKNATTERPEQIDPKTSDNRVVIFDTTLRDGEQSPGASMNLSEKIVIAQALRDLRVDVIEAGFPIASPGDFEAVRAIARQVQGPTIAGLARCQKQDIDRAWDALQDATHKRIHVFLATSAIHREYKLNMAKEEIVRRAVEGVTMARAYCDDVEFSAEDAARTEPDFLAEVVERVIEAGATTVNIPDTVGYAMPNQFSDLIHHLKSHVRDIDKAIISVHCHNDLGMAVANSLAAVKAGARQIECTINGIGERAGNCSLEEAVMAMRTRRDYFDLETNINTRAIFPTSKLVSNITGLHVQRNKAIVGQNAFAHEAGIHQHGVLKHQETYEIMKPEDVGIKSNQLVLGKHSGRHAFRNWVEEHGYTLSDEEFQRAFEAFKVLADKKKDIYDADIEALIEGGLNRQDTPWQIVSIQTNAGTNAIPTATIALLHAGENRRVEEAACGDGPVDALYKAIERVVGFRVRLKDYQLRSITRGKDAQGEISIAVEIDNRTYRGRSVSTDIMEASAKAFLNVINGYINQRERSLANAAAGAEQLVGARP